MTSWPLSLRIAFFTVTGLLAAVVGSPAPAATSCSAHSTPAVPATVVELYTSEGCDSCPPADRWLSRLRSDPAVVALAFHVDYWDRLGWKDRFASPAYTQRQAEQQAVSGARFSYTPQVIVNGVDRPDWPRASIDPGRRDAAPVDLQLVRDGTRVTAVVTPFENAPARLAAYWAVTEAGHRSDVKAGENQGVTLSHDHVVREYVQVAAWVSHADAPPVTLKFDLKTVADPAHPRQISLVVVDAGTGRLVQAAQLGC